MAAEHAAHASRKWARLVVPGLVLVLVGSAVVVGRWWGASSGGSSGGVAGGGTAAEREGVGAGTGTTRLYRPAVVWSEIGESKSRDKRVRRTHPRDTLVPELAAAKTCLAAGKRPPETCIPLLPLNATNVDDVADAWRRLAQHVPDKRQGAMARAVAAALASPTSVIPANTRAYIQEFLARPLSLVFPAAFSAVSPHAFPPPLLASTTRYHAPPFFNETDAGRCWWFARRGLFKCLPSLVVMGFQRCSTRELHEWLAAHPLTAAYVNPSSPSLETHFFDSLGVSKAFHSLQPLRRSEVRGELAEAWPAYLEAGPALDLSDVLGRIAVFEKTPAYADESDPSAMAELLPSVKLLVSVRDPGARLYSAFWRRCDRFVLNCSVELFVDQMLAPAERAGFASWPLDHLDDFATKKVAFFPSGFEARAVVLGSYAHYLERFRRAFAVSTRSSAASNAAAMFILFAESFATMPFRVIDEVQAFAGLARPKFDYTKVARKSRKGYFYVSELSRSLTPKPKAYVPLTSSPQLTCRLERLYRAHVGRFGEWVRAATSSSSASSRSSSGLRVVVSAFKAEWFEASVSASASTTTTLEECMRLPLRLTSSPTMATSTAAMPADAETEEDDESEDFAGGGDGDN